MGENQRGRKMKRKKLSFENKKLYTEEQMKEFAISFTAFALKEGEPVDLIFDEDYKEHAEELFKKYEEAQDEEV